MRALIRLALTAVCVAVSVPAQSGPAHPAIVARFKQTNPGLAAVHVVFRVTLPGDHNLMVARASRNAQYSQQLRWFWWSRGDVLGLFIQDGRDPGRIRELGMLPAAGADYAVTVDRADAASIVFSRTEGDYALAAPSLKVFFDLRAGRVTGVTEYSPVAVFKALRQNGRLHFITSDGKALAPWRMDESGPVPDQGNEAAAALAAAGELRADRLPIVPTGAPLSDPRARIDYHPLAGSLAVAVASLREPYGEVVAGIAGRIGGKYRLYTLPASTCQAFRRARPRRVENGYCEGAAPDFHEEIGPHRIVEGRFWYGKIFYDGEGTTGIGAIGYFDERARKYVEFSPPDLADWSVSALLVEPGAVWAGLLTYPEGGAYGGGLLRYDRAAARASKLDIPDIILSLARHGNAVYAGTVNGIWETAAGGLCRWVLEPEPGGKMVFHATGARP